MKHGPRNINPLNVELNPIYHFLELLGAHHILHISQIRVKLKGWCSVLSTYGGRLLQSCCIFCLPQIIQTQGPLAQLHVTFKFRLITKHTHTHILLHNAYLRNNDLFKNGRDWRRCDKRNVTDMYRNSSHCHSVHSTQHNVSTANCFRLQVKLRS